MAEVSFVKSFLSTLDSRPTKLSSDHVEDPRSYPSRSAYVLPRMPKPMSKRAKPANPGHERSVTVVLKSLRNPPLDIKLPSQSLGTSVLDIKTEAAARARVPVDRMRLLHRKKPVPDSKVLRDLVGDEAVVEFSVMVLGGAGAAAGADAPGSREAPTAQGPSGLEVIQSDPFWAALRGFLLQRIRDEKLSDELFGLFKRAWDDRT